MTDVVASELPVGAPPNGLIRVRCSSCAMPVRGNPSTCWSCGLDPTDAAEVEVSAQEVRPSSGRGRFPGRRLLAGAGLALVVVALLGCITVLVSPDRSRGVRGLSARIRGDAWQRAGVLGGSAQFPAAPVRRTMALGRGGRPHAEALTAETPGLRTELVAADLADAANAVEDLGAGQSVAMAAASDMNETVASEDPLSLAARLLSAYSAAAGGRVAHEAPRAAGELDALVAEPGGEVRVRVSVVGSTGYLMAVAGPAEAFGRFTESFQHLGPVPEAPPPTS